MATKKEALRTNNPLPNLPDEIILDILKVVPTKSLVRFGCVCKAWLALFAEPGFTKMRGGQQRLLILSCLQPRSSISVESMDFEAAALGDSSNTVVNIDLPLIPDQYNIEIIWGSCNGLLLCSLNLNLNLNLNDDDLFLFNPTTRQCKQLPQRSSTSNSSCLVLGIYKCIFYGFGYDSSIDDYKVVIGHYENTMRVEVQVYSRRTNSWKRIQYSPYYPGLFFQNQGALVNGFLHWLPADRQLLSAPIPSPVIIISFDLEKEIFGPVSLPPMTATRTRIGAERLGVLEGSLCLVCSNDDGSQSIWLMKEYGVKESWTKLTTIPPFLLSLTGYVTIVPLCITKATAELIMQVKSKRIVKYNFQEKTYKDLLVKDFINQSAIYVESFVSPTID